MKCPICGESSMDEIDNELICQGCGSAFLLEYSGMYEEGGDERIDDGFQSSDYMSTYGTKINIFKGLITQEADV